MSDNIKHMLVVGSGLSGLCVSLQLLRRGVQVTLVDNDVNHSSIVAAGMINPLVFRRMNKSWRVDEFLPYLNDFYKGIEHETGANFFHHITIRRMFSSEQERQMWTDKQGTADFSPYMFPITEEDSLYNAAINDFGSARLKGSCYVDTKVFIPSIKDYLEKHIQILHEEFDHNKLEDLSYNGVKYSDVIFCEGYLGKDNPWFSELPLGQTKGETLLIHADSLPEDVSLNRKCFVLPKGEKTFKIGSNYQWNTTDPSPSDQGRETILNNLSYLTKENVEVIEHDAGIRPTTVDRRPLIGTHTEKTNYHIFNGLGSKGYMIAPLLSKEFVEYLLEKKPLHKEANIVRFKKK